VYTLASRAVRRRSGLVAVAALFVAVFTISLVHEVNAPAASPVPSHDVPGVPRAVGLDRLPAEKRAAIDAEARRKGVNVPGVPEMPALPAGKPGRPVPGQPFPEGKPVLPPDDPVDGPEATALDQLAAIDPTDVGALRKWFADRTFGALGTALFPMLVLGLALAFGDGVRSRRAHLYMLEQRAADLEHEQHQRAALAAAAERARITRELHDVVAHGMSVMVVQAQGGAAALRRHPDRTATALENVITTGRASLAEMRRLLGVVSRDPADDPQLAPQPGLCSVPSLVDQVRAAGTEVHLRIDGQPTTLPASVDLSAYRIVQEALTNTIKHAGPGAEAEVRLVFAPDWVEVEITDDGAGGAGDPQAPSGPGGNGLRGIAERVGVLRGELAVGPGAGGRGFRVWALLPTLAPAADSHP
jgi:signal transduction histidine kinase